MWKESLLTNDVTPSSQQWQVLDLVHARCLYEWNEERNHSINATEPPNAWEPLFRLIHGLPGAGKSQLMKWIQRYFQAVWKWLPGVHYQVLAPLNSMAAGIGGVTVHSWGGVAFQNKDGVNVSSHSFRANEDNIGKMNLKCARLRFLCIDECEAVGAGLGASLEEAVVHGVPQRNSYRYHCEGPLKDQAGILPRGFGGINVLLFGDFYQLAPVSGTAFMSNPWSEATLGNAQVANMMARIWSCFDHDGGDDLQMWSEPVCDIGCKVMDLEVNYRSGGDECYSDVLTACREGNLDEADWQFLHGAPTLCCGSWMSRQGRSICGQQHCTGFKENTKSLRETGMEAWIGEIRQGGNKYECDVCIRERVRRHRVLGTGGGGAAPRFSEILCSDRFKDCLYITRCNEPAATYAIERARIFGKMTGRQLLWVQAEDFMNSMIFADLSAEEKREKKRRWLRPDYHARRTGGIPSLFPMVFDLPVRLNNADYGAKQKELKLHGVYNQARGRLRGWELHDEDLALLDRNAEAEVVLRHLPKRIFVEMESKE
jgi:hypothetical protein